MEVFGLTSKFLKRKCREKRRSFSSHTPPGFPLARLQSGCCKARNGLAKSVNDRKLLMWKDHQKNCWISKFFWRERFRFSFSKVIMKHEQISRISTMRVLGQEATLFWKDRLQHSFWWWVWQEGNQTSYRLQVGSGFVERWRIVAETISMTLVAIHNGSSFFQFASSWCVNLCNHIA